MEKVFKMTDFKQKPHELCLPPALHPGRWCDIPQPAIETNSQDRHQVLKKNELGIHENNHSFVESGYI